jgi:hypothetical protein
VPRKQQLGGGERQEAADEQCAARREQDKRGAERAEESGRVEQGGPRLSLL